MNTMKRLLVTAAFIAGLTTQTFAQDLEKLTVRTDWLPWGIHAGLHLATEKGWFKEAGLDVEVSDGKGSNLTMQQVAAGEVDVGQVQLSSMAVARGSGMPVISIAGLARRGDLCAIVPTSSGMRTVKDLEGKKVAYTATSSWGALADLFLSSGGTDRSKIDLVNVDATSLMSGYLAGTVDAVLTTYPFAKPTADLQIPSSGILLADAGFNLPSYGLIASVSTVESKKEALAKFVPVVVRAWEYIYDGNIDEAVAAIVSQRPAEKLDTNIIRAQIVEFEPFFTTEATKDARFGWQSEEEWQAAIDILASVNAIPAGGEANDFFTNEFVEK